MNRGVKIGDAIGCWDRIVFPSCALAERLPMDNKVIRCTTFILCANNHLGMVGSIISSLGKTMGHSIIIYMILIAEQSPEDALIANSEADDGDRGMMDRGRRAVLFNNHVPFVPPAFAGVTLTVGKWLVR